MASYEKRVAKTLNRRHIMKAAITVSLGSLACSSASRSKSLPKEYHVAVNGDDRASGSLKNPLRTITAAASRAMPGDTVIVHEGIYRERVDPPRGGTSDNSRITYLAAQGERVEISGSEVAKGWIRQQDDVWKLVLPNSYFGSFNPYCDQIHGDWFDAKDRAHHTGAVYLNGHWFIEASNWDELLKPAEGEPLWYGQVEKNQTTIWAQFPGVNPNLERVEINVRQSVFFPKVANIDYITVKGFVLRHAATPWAPPTAGQLGLIGPYWSKGWIIEDNEICYSTCSGVSLGKIGDKWDNTSANSAEGYVNTIDRAIAEGWTKERIGHHTVRRNLIHHCEQAGIVGSMGGAFSLISDNTIHSIYIRQLFYGQEMAGIKLHAAIDTEISRNHVFNCGNFALWLDWMAQGTRVNANIFHDNLQEDLFCEVNHGPFIVDNNLFLSKLSLQTRSQGGTFAHNIFCGKIRSFAQDDRQTPIMKAHSTSVASYHDNPSGDLRFFNNIFAVQSDLSTFDTTVLPMVFEGNVFLKGAGASTQDRMPLKAPDFDPRIELSSDSKWLTLSLDGAWSQVHRQLVTTALMGDAAVSKLPFVSPEGADIRIDRDFCGQLRDRSNPFPGPFEVRRSGRLRVKLSRS